MVESNLMFRAQAEAHGVAAQKFVLLRTPYQRIARAGDPAAEAVMATREATDSGASGIDLGWAHKAMVEHAYETVRRRVAPNSPSRLRSIYAFLDLQTAVEFAQSEWREVVYEMSPRASARFSVHDMDLYMPPAEIDVEVAAFKQRWADASEWAIRYWTETSNPVRPEALIDGRLKIHRIAWRLQV